MAVNLKGRSFLTLQDFTPAEIRYLLDLGHDLKAKRRAGIDAPTLKGKHIVLLFEKHPPVLAALLKWRRRRRVLMLLSWTRTVPKWEKRRALRILQRCSAGILTGLNTAGLIKKWWKILRNGPVCRFGMD